MSVMFEPLPRGAQIVLGYAGRIGAATALVLTAVLAGCATPRGPVTAPVPEQRPPAGQVPSVQTGYASWYGKRHHGRETASGEAYNMNALTAAHPSLPLGTRLRVTNLRNGRSVEVRVNDRGPVVDGRVLDLSYAAARDLGAVAPGVIPVRVRVIALPAQ
jgi:rare lipoprotein A (peptidoglycan hydrolase)